MERSKKLLKAQETYDQVKLEDDIDKIIEVYNASPEHKQRLDRLYHTEEEGASAYFNNKEVEDKE